MLEADPDAVTFGGIFARTLVAGVGAMLFRQSYLQSEGFHSQDPFQNHSFDHWIH